MNARAWTWLGRAGAAAFAAAVAVGLVHSLHARGRVPGVAMLDYESEVRRAVDSGDAARALRQLRLAAVLRADDPKATGPGLRVMAELAHRERDAASEIFALRRLVRLDPADRDARIRLSSALLEASPRDMAVLKEAASNAEIAVQIDPRAATAWLNLARIADELGQTDRAANFRQRALDIEPGLESLVTLPSGYWRVP